MATAPKIRKSISGLSARELGWRGGSAGWSIREYVHHLVEANLVASTIVLAALGGSGCEFDWSWMMPDAHWMKGLRYDRAPIAPALALLDSLGAHVGGLVRILPGAMRRHVRLVGTRGGRARPRSVSEVLGDECAHARQHLRDIAETRKAHGRARPGAPGRIEG
jgi:hypothetical protein